MSGDVLAVDLGGTNMRVAIASPEGVITGRAKKPTPKTPDVGALVDLVREVGGPAGCRSAVVGVPGRVHYGSGAVEWAPNLPAGWAEQLHDDLLTEALGMDVAMANDADLAAVGEAWFGAGKGHRDVAYMTVSTGIGAGVVTNGLLVHGRRSLAELGHAVLDLDAVPDGPFTVEALGSGTAMARRAREAGMGGDVRGPEITRRWQEGDPEATAVWDATIRAAALGAVTLAQLFTPEVIVVGGGLGLVGEAVLGPMRELVARHGPSDLPEPIAVVSAALGDDAALAGAGAWSRAFSPGAASRTESDER